MLKIFRIDERIISRFIMVLGFNKKKLHSIFLTLFYFSLVFNENLIAQDLLLNNPKEPKNDTLNTNKLDDFGDVQKFLFNWSWDILELTLLDATEFSGEYKVLNDGTILYL